MATVTKTLKETGGDYDNFILWESTEQADLVAAGDTHELHISGTFTNPDADNAVVAGWITDATHFVKVECLDDGALHNGFWTATAYRIEGERLGIRSQDDYTQFIGIQAHETAVTDPFAGDQQPIHVNFGDNSLVENCIAWATWNSAEDDNSQELSGVMVSNSTGTVVRNTLAIVENIHGTGAPDDFWGFILTGTEDGTFQSCTAILSGPSRGTPQSGEAFGFRDAAGNKAVFVNCLSENNVTGATTKADFSTASTFAAGTDYNASKDATAPGGNSLTSRTFVFTDAGNNDYSLDAADESGAKTGGDDLSGTFTNDLAGATRVDWSIGAYEFISGGGGGAVALGIVTDLHGISTLTIFT